MEVRNWCKTSLWLGIPWQGQTMKPQPQKSMHLELWHGEPAELNKEAVQKNALIKNYCRTHVVGLEITVPLTPLPPLS